MDTAASDRCVPGLAEAEQLLATADRLYSEVQIDAAIRRMAGEIDSALHDRLPIVLPILLGGLFTASRLSAHFGFPYEFDRVQAGRYGHAESGGELQWTVEPALDCRDRVVLIVDDILDRGVTLQAVRRRMLSAGAAAVQTAVLVVKDVLREEPVAVDYTGVHCDDRFVFGCGMDYRGLWRGLPALYALPASG